MKKAEEFNNILDDCLERLLIKGETIEQCLQSYPEYAAEIKPLLQTAMATKQALAIQPHPEFKTRARYQFHSALQQVKPKRATLFWGWQPQWAMVVAIILAFLLVGSGTVAAANGSMPDETLYPVKLATEQVRMVLTPSTLGKAELYVKLVDRRVAEIVRMAGKSKPEQVERTTQRLDAYLTKIAVLALTQEVGGGGVMAPAVEEAPAVREAPAAEEAPAVEEAPLLPERAGGGDEARIKVNKWAKLRVIMARNAVDHPVALRAALQKAPPSVKLALRRAIALSETGYGKALKSLD